MATQGCMYMATQEYGVLAIVRYVFGKWNCLVVLLSYCLVTQEGTGTQVRIETQAWRCKSVCLRKSDGDARVYGVANVYGVARVYR